MKGKTLPTGWIWVTPEEIASPEPHSLGIGPFGSDLKVSDYNEDGVPLVFVRNIRSGVFGSVGDRFVSHGKAEKLRAHCVLPGDVLITKMGEPPGDVCLYPENRPPAIMTADCVRLRLSGAILCRKYFVYAIRSEIVRDQIVARTTGVAQQKISLERFKSIVIPMAPLEEQARLVDEIERQFSRIDAGIAALKRIQANLKRQRAAILKAACEGRLVPTEADLARAEGRSYESATVLLARIAQTRSTGAGDDGKGVDTSDLQKLPEGWAWASFEELSERVTVGYVGPMKHEYVPSGVPFLRSQNVRENRFDPAGLLHISSTFHERISKSMLRPGDIVVVRSGAVGTACVIPDTIPEANCSDLVIIQRPRGIVPYYGAYFMNSAAKGRVRAGQVGIALTHFNTRSVAAIPVAVPPLSEQLRIVAEVQRSLSLIDELEAMIKATLARAERLRQAVLRQAFEGKLVPQDPNDEPASVLLDRLRAEQPQPTPDAPKRRAPRRRTPGVEVE